MGRSIFLLLLLLVFTTSQPAEAPMSETTEYPPFLITTSDSIALLDGARSAMSANKFDEAELFLRQLWKRKDGMIAAVYHRTEIAMCRTMSSDSREDYEHFADESDRLRRLLRRAPMSAGIDYLTAEAARQRLFVWANRGENVKAALALKASYSRLEDLVKRHPTYYEAYKTIGLLDITLATLPESHRNILKIAGLEGTVIQGRNELALAADSSHYSAAEAAEYLEIISRYDARVNLLESPEIAMSRLHVAYRGRQLVGLIYGDKLLRGSFEKRALPVGKNTYRALSSVMSNLPDPHQLQSGNYGAGSPVPYSSGE